MRLKFFDAALTPISVPRFLGQAIEVNGTRHGKKRQLGDNEWEFLSLVPGPYWVSVDVPGYERQLQTAYIDNETYLAQMPIMLEPGESSNIKRNDVVALLSTNDRLHTIVSEEPMHSYALRFKLIDADDYTKSIQTAKVSVFAAGLTLIEQTISDGQFAGAWLVPGSLSFEVKANGYAAFFIELAPGEAGDLGRIGLRSAIRVVARVVFPSEINMSSIGCGYSDLSAFTCYGKSWDARPLGSNAFLLELTEDRFIATASASNAGERWATPLTVFDNPKDGEEIILHLQKKVPVVIAPSGSSEPLEIEITNSAGLIAGRKIDYADIPWRLSMLPGEYVLSFPNREFEARPLVVGQNEVRISL